MVRFLILLPLIATAVWIGFLLVRGASILAYVALPQILIFLGAACWAAAYFTGQLYWLAVAAALIGVGIFWIVSRNRRWTGTE